VETCTWIARNMPFVDHVALMGLENTGFAIANAELLWIDPIDYQSELADAVDLLVSAKLNVSVYNLQRCVLDRSVWPYSVQSISDWKNGYIDDCYRCIEKIDAAAFLRQVARAEVAALIRYLHPSLDFSWVRFVFGSSHS